ncbi:MAG: hypothetical protein JWR74_3220 [Polaromonas sp.]|nr:hypothetical protein [Polaromonas sp.]
MSSLWEVTGQFICTASDTVICKLTTAGEPYAALIASAPDLLAERDRLKALNAELAAAVKAFLTYDSSSTDGVGFMFAYDEALKKCRAALEKHNKESACK